MSLRLNDLARKFGLFFILMLALLSHPSYGGNGSLNAAERTVDLTVLLAYPPPASDITTVRNTMQEASNLLCDITEGQLRLGTVTLKSGNCVGGTCQTGAAQADIRFTPTSNPGAGQASVCLGEACSSLGTSGADVVLSRFYLDNPVTVAHELGHYILNLGDGYRQYQCRPHRPPYAELIACDDRTETSTSIMLADDCEGGPSSLYSELMTDATFPAPPQAVCAAANDVFAPGGNCAAESACPDVGGYSANYDGFRNETMNTLLLCNAFNPATCEYEWAATQWFSFHNHGAVLSEFEQAALNLKALNDNTDVINVVTGVPEPDINGIAFCNQQVVFDDQIEIANQVVLLLDRSYSMAFPPSDEFEKCDPGGCPEICDNNKDDDNDGTEDESDCANARMVSLKALSTNYVDFMANAGGEAVELGVRSFACNSSPEIGPMVITQGDFNDYSNAINGLNPNGGTAIADALTDAAASFDPGGNRAILLVTDGFNSCGNPDVSGVLDDLADQGIVVNAISYGPSVASMQASQIAEATGGKLVSVPLANDLGPAFALQWANQVEAGKLIPQLPYHLRFLTGGPGIERIGKTVDANGSQAPFFGVRRMICHLSTWIDSSFA